MNRYSKFIKRFELEETILIDGATGTEAERRGVPQLKNAWNGGGALSNPDIIRHCLLYTSPSPRDVEEWGVAGGGW